MPSIHHGIEYREIPGHSDYMAGYDGSIASKKLYGKVTFRIISQRLNDQGYMRVRIMVESNPMDFKVHQLIMMAFGPPKPSSRHEIRHCDGIKTNNHADNLKWGTSAENKADRIRHGTSNRGERHGLSKLTRAQVDEILSRTGETQQELATRFGIHQSTVSDIRRKKRWNWVK
jgi:hypothetical protein